MANRCAGLIDPATWPHLPATGHCHSTSSSSWFAAFENEALTCALRASMTPAASSSSPSYPNRPTTSCSSSSELVSDGHVDAPAPRAAAPLTTGRPKAGRVTKRGKPRPSSRRRPSPTYIVVADPANFRRMVQEVTGLPDGVRRQQAITASAAATTSVPTRSTPPPARTLPTLDTSAFLLIDRAAATTTLTRGADGKSSSGGGASPSVAAAVAVEKDDDSSVLRELDAMACAPRFPTLESWGII